MREKLINALMSHAQGHIDKHLANIEIYLNNPVGTGDVGDVINILEGEFEEIAKYIDQLEIIETYLVNKSDDLPTNANIA